MMKKKKKLLCILLAVILCFSVSTPAMAASVSYTKATKAYKRWVTNMKAKYPYRYYDIVDIDGNGIPELMISMRTLSYGESRVYTYNVKASKMILLKKCYLARGTGPAITYNTKKKSFTLYALTTASYALTYYKLNGSKATKTTSFSWESGKLDLSGIDKYSINGTSYSKSAYDKKYNSAKSGFKTLRYKM